MNVVDLLAPGSISPESQPALSLVEVWVTPESFLHVTVVPLGIVKLAGENELALMTTVFGGVVDGARFVPEGFDESLLHPNIPTIIKPIITPVIPMLLFILVLLLLLSCLDIYLAFVANEPIDEILFPPTSRACIT